MDDQFGGRTDDDLFADDFEPIAPTRGQAQAPKAAAGQDAESPKPLGAAESGAGTTPQAAAQQSTGQLAPPAASIPAASPAAASPAPKLLAQSRHNRQTPPQRPRRGPAGGRPSPSSAPRQSTPDPVVRGAGGGGSDSMRLQSGANPRTKLTDEELAAKMDEMRIRALERTRRFEQAQRDESDHALAYARGMEEAKKRRAVEEEKRRRAETDRLRLEQEREKNRGRKLQAMGLKEGSWDEGKQERLAEEERRGFRSAHGGIRGSRHRPTAGDQPAGGRGQPYEERGPGERGGPRNPDRGRGGARGGRGGRGIGQPSTGPGHADAAPQLASKDDFPALPAAPAAEQERSSDSSLTIQPPLPSQSPPIGKWDDEMAAIDARQAQ